MGQKFCCLLALVILGTPTFSDPAGAAIAEYTSGHVDIGVRYVAGELDLHFDFADNAIIDGIPVGNGQSIYSPEQAYIRIPDSQERPNLSLPSVFNFTGVPPGSSLWILPRVEAAGVPFVGLATEKLEPSDWGPITLSLGATTMPTGAQFSLWNFPPGSNGAPNAIFSTFAPQDTTGTPKNTLVLPTGTHEHYDWGFTEPGLYEIELTVSGTHVVDGLKSDSGTFIFAIGNATAVPEPGSLLLLGAGAIGVVTGLRRRARLTRDLPS